MFETIFGAVWLIFTTICFFMFFSQTLSNSSAQFSFNYLVMLSPFAIIFYGIGIWMFTKGLKKIIRDTRTNKYGINTFGKVLHIKTTGNVANGVPEFAAEIATYIPEYNDFMVITESVGFGNMEYQPGTFVDLKFFNNDINVIKPMESVNISSVLRERINEQFPTEEDKPKEIYIDGVRYIRED